MSEEQAVKQEKAVSKAATPSKAKGTPRKQNKQAPADSDASKSASADLTASGPKSEPKLDDKSTSIVPVTVAGKTADDDDQDADGDDEFDYDDAFEPIRRVAYWSAQIQPEENVVADVPYGCMLRLRTASLGVEANDKSRSAVLIRPEGRSVPDVLCHLLGNAPHSSFDLIFTENEVEFTVKGNTPVHVTGLMEIAADDDDTDEDERRFDSSVRMDDDSDELARGQFGDSDEDAVIAPRRMAGKLRDGMKRAQLAAAGDDDDSDNASLQSLPPTKLFKPKPPANNTAGKKQSKTTAKSPFADQLSQHELNGVFSDEDDDVFSGGSKDLFPVADLSPESAPAAKAQGKKKPPSKSQTQPPPQQQKKQPQKQQQKQPQQQQAKKGQDGGGKKTGAGAPPTPAVGGDGAAGANAGGKKKGKGKNKRKGGPDGGSPAAANASNPKKTKTDAKGPGKQQGKGGKKSKNS